MNIQKAAVTAVKRHIEQRREWNVVDIDTSRWCQIVAVDFDGDYHFVHCGVVNEFPKNVAEDERRRFEHEIIECVGSGVVADTGHQLVYDTGLIYVFDNRRGIMQYHARASLSS